MKENGAANTANTPRPTKSNGHTINARSAAFLALRQIDREDAYANIAFKQVLNQYRLPSQEARLAAQITYGTTRMQLALDHLIGHFLKKPLDQLMPELRIILRLSIFQLHYLRTEEYAAVNEGVALTKKFASPKLAGLANGILRNYLRSDREHLLPGRDEDLRRYLHITLSYPTWFVDYLLGHYTPEEAECFCIHCNTHRGIAIRSNSLRCTAAELQQMLADEGIPTETAGYAPETLRLAGEAGNLAAQHFFRDGYFTVQGLSSQLAAHALSPAPGSRVLDLCAAPGGKTTHMAALMEDKGEICAFDVHPHKTALIRSNAERLGIHIIQAETADSRLLPENYRGWADYILLDAPCSGLGVLGVRADSRFRKENAAVGQLARLSGQLLESAAGYLKPGGRILYSTCTITEEENGANVHRFLVKHPDFHLIPLEGLLPLLPHREKELRQGEIQLLPFHDDKGMDGFYMALLEKNNE